MSEQLTWAELIARIDVNEEPGTRNDSPVEAYGSFEPFIECLNLPQEAYGSYSVELDRRLCKHWIVSWVCRDTRVGLAVYVLDKKPVAVSHQRFRKSDETVLFMNAASAEQLRQVLVSFCESPTDKIVLVESEPTVNKDWFVRDFFDRVPFEKTVNS